MKRKGFTAVTLLFFVYGISAQVITISPGMKVGKTTKFKKAVYKIDGPADSSRGVVNIEGNNIVVDFGGAELRGDNSAKAPDEFSGIAVYIRNSKNITIKNLKTRGYKVALIARNTEKLTIENCDFSYNYRRRLNSTQEKEDISDWMSYHHNEKDEWLRYGAAMYLKDCSFFTVRSCKVTGGQNALMLMRCNDGLIVNNDFSFNSGIGIGMYRSNRNRVSYNRVIFNVRGYSHGVYNRGQDSAGILVYEQSNNNRFYNNNVTHGGDGLFLWAGQTTMDSGKGGCNDNVIIENDFSYAPTNGVEVTFSRNHIIENRIFECDHGIWGGYSFESTISDNQFRNNRIAIAIEHGQQNKILYNLFSGDKEAIRLWARNEQPTDWGYAKFRDTKSRDYAIVYNSFNNIPIVFNFKMTNNLSVYGNTISQSDAIFKIDSTVSGLDTTVNQKLEKELSIDTATVAIEPTKKYMDPFVGNPKFAGRKNIMITEWGPYDFRYPIIWNTNPADTSDTMRFDLIGPHGNWQIKSVKGLKDVSVMKGTFPASVTARKETGERTDILIELVYTGESFTTAMGEKIPAGKPYNFRFRKFFQPVNWEVMFYRLDTASHNPITTGMLFSLYEKKAPFRTEKKDRLDYAWWGGIKEAGIHYPQFITMANGTVEIKPGNYELSVTWDDAVRVYVDENLVFDEWNPSRYRFDESPNKKIRIGLGGKHHFRVEHLELGGFATLALKIKPVE